MGRLLRYDPSTLMLSPREAQSCFRSRTNNETGRNQAQSKLKVATKRSLDRLGAWIALFYASEIHTGRGRIARQEQSDVRDDPSSHRRHQCLQRMLDIHGGYFGGGIHSTCLTVRVCQTCNELGYLLMIRLGFT